MLWKCLLLRRRVLQIDGRPQGSDGVCAASLVTGWSIAIMMVITVIGGCERSADDAPESPTVESSAAQQGQPDELPPEVQALLATFPPLEVEPELLDFGEVMLANPVEKNIRLINTSSETLRIQESRSNCGCTTPDMSGVVIEPNSFTEVPVHFDAEGRTGDRSAVVTIVVDGYERPLRMRVRAHVVEP